MISPISRPTRRAACAALVGVTAKAGRRIQGGFVFESQMAGHAIRDKQTAIKVTRTVKTPCVIVGGGMAGLSAGWWLEKQGFRDFVILEIEKEAGGNSRWGENSVSAYPWGAHYVPVPNKDAALVRELFTEFGLLVDGQWDERWLCHSPQERLFLHGRWQEGLEPETGMTPEDRRQFAAFDQRMKEFRSTGQFTLPMALGAPKDSPLDRLNIRAWMDQNGFRSPYLRWLVDYSTRDDYGADAAETSAWAGIHYFASREHEEKGPFTWPEGNGWILRRLLAKLNRFVRVGQGAMRIEPMGSRWRVLTADTAWESDTIIYAAPSFLLPYLDSTARPVKGMNWSPWVVTNLTLDRPPAERGLEPAWDNVIYGSSALGYVVATHQSLARQRETTVWTHYWALTGREPGLIRKELLQLPWETHIEKVLQDLERPHPDIRACVTHADAFRIGHAMIRPEPGFLTNPERLGWIAGARAGLYQANSDLSGFSIFEEAQFRGVEAAKKALFRISGKKFN